MSETIDLIQRCHSISFQDLPRQVIETTKSLFLDYLGVAMRGSQTASARSAQNLARRFQSSGANMAIIGTDIVCDPLHAAFANGIAAHSIECDDVVNEASVHPAVTVMTTALSAAEWIGGCSGEALIAAIVAGYETVIRLGVAVDPASHYARGFHPTATCGTFAAAMTAARLLKLNPQQTANALGIAGSQAAGSMEYLTDGAYTKRFHGGWASKSGLTAALLAADGFTGPQTIIEGRFGFLHGYSDNPKPEQVTANWANPYKIMKTSIKPYSCCRYKQGPIDCILDIARNHEITADDVAAINTGILSAGFALVAEPIEKKRRPQTVVDAQFSMPFGAAVAILYGNAGLDQYTTAVLHSEEVCRLMDRVSCTRDPSLDALYPSKWPATVQLHTKDGRLFESKIEYPKGDPENALTWNEIQQKFTNLAQPVLATLQIREIIQSVAALEKLEDVRQLATQSVA